jgi:glycosyltransferase involved in cell wall biosynthesis
MKTALIRAGIDRSKLTPFPLGVTFENNKGKAKGRVSRETLGLGSMEPVAIYFGSLSKFRELDFILDVMKLVIRRLPSARLIVLGGNTNEVNLLREKSIRMGLEKTILFHEKVSRENVLNFIDLADVGVSPIPPKPMYVNSYPTKLIETLAAGKPVIANSEITEQKLLIDESGGGLCVPYKAETFGQALVELLREPGRARQMGIAGMNYVKEHNSYTKMTIELEELYFRLQVRPQTK